MNPWTFTDMSDLCEFVRAHYRPWANATLESLRAYFNWYAMMNLLGVVQDDGEIIAVAIFRAFHKLEDYRTEFVHDPAGQYIRINLYGATMPQAFAVLFGQLAQKQDLKGRTFLWHRDAEELGPPRQYSLKRLVRMAEIMLKRGAHVERVTTNTT
jgi:hypothetical protein